MFGRAVELDPTFAPAQAGIVICECYLYESRATNLTPAELLAMADRTLALALDHFSAESGGAGRRGNMQRETLTYEADELTSLSVWDLTPAPEAVRSEDLWRQFLNST